MMEKIARLKERYQALFPNNHFYCSEEELNKTEKKLNLILPEDFRKIAMFASSLGVGYIDFFNFSYDEKDDYSICCRTEFYRKNINLPHKYLALAESSVSMVLIDTNTEQALYLDVLKALRMCDGESITEKDEYIYPNFSSFFEHLLTLEEQDRADEGKTS